MLHDPKRGPVLSPGYDMLATVLVNPDDKEELALNLNGKKRKITRDDFKAAFTGSHLDVKQQTNIFKKMEKARTEWFDFIDISFLNEDLKNSYKAFIQQRFERLT